MENSTLEVEVDRGRPRARRRRAATDIWHFRRSGQWRAGSSADAGLGPGAAVASAGPGRDRDRCSPPPLVPSLPLHLPPRRRASQLMPPPPPCHHSTCRGPWFDPPVLDPRVAVGSLLRRAGPRRPRAAARPVPRAPGPPSGKSA